MFKQVLHDGAKEVAQNDINSSKYAISEENKVQLTTNPSFFILLLPYYGLLMMVVCSL
jgi:hypothetical protein